MKAFLSSLRSPSRLPYNPLPTSDPALSDGLRHRKPHTSTHIELKHNPSPQLSQTYDDHELYVLFNELLESVERNEYQKVLEFKTLLTKADVERIHVIRQLSQDLKVVLDKIDCQDSHYFAKAMELVRKGAFIDTRTERYTLLRLAMRFNREDVVQQALQLRANPNDIQKEYTRPRTLLMSAVSHEQTNIVKLLLKAGADPHHTPKEGKLVLSYASSVSMMDLLVRAMGGMPRVAHIPPTDDKTLHSLYRQIRLFADNNDAAAIVDIWNSLSEVDLQRLIVIDEVTMELKDALNITNSSVVTTKQCDTILSLIHRGADPDASYMYTALQRAARDGRCDMITKLVQLGARVDFRAESYARTPLMEAVNNNHLEAVKILLSLGANPHEKLSSGTTLLMMTSNMNMLYIVAEAMSTTPPPSTIPNGL